MAVDKDLLIVMNTVDDTRDHMPEGQYLKTCDALKRVHKKLQRPSLPIPDEIRIPMTKRVMYFFTATVSVVKIIEAIKKKMTT